MFLSDMLIELIENTPIETAEDETYLLLFIYEVCVDEIKENVPKIGGKYCKDELSFQITHLNNILNAVKLATGTKLYPKNPLLNHIFGKELV